MFKKAIRPKVKLKVILYGTPWSGKTYWALRLAKGIWGKTAMINSEWERGYLYANNFDYDILTLDNCSPEAYTRAIKGAIDAWYENLIIDSVSHEREYVLNKSSEKWGSMFVWKDLTPRHNKFIESIAFGDINIIATARSKVEYSIDKDSSWKTSIEKVGTTIKQRDWIEYEYMVSLLVNQNHTCTISKDNTWIFINPDVTLDESIWEKLWERAKSWESVSIVKELDKTNKFDIIIINVQDEVNYTPSKDIVDKCKKLRATWNKMWDYIESIKSIPSTEMNDDSKKFILWFIDNAKQHFIDNEWSEFSETVQSEGWHEHTLDKGWEAEVLLPDELKMD